MSVAAVLLGTALGSAAALFSLLTGGGLVASFIAYICLGQIGILATISLALVAPNND